MILVDANISMYASGAQHSNRKPAIEVIHRYTALGRWHEGSAVYLIARQLFPDVLLITGTVLDAAKGLVDKLSGLTARDAVHAAVVSVYGLDGICTFDRDQGPAT